MDDLRRRTVAMLDRLTDDQVALVQDYARYLRDKRGWDEAAAILPGRDLDHESNVLEKLLAES